MESYRKGFLITEKTDLKFKFRGTQPDDYEVGSGEDFDQDGIADRFDDIPFDPRYSNIGTDDTEREEFLQAINPGDVQTDFNKLMKQYYKSNYDIDPMNPDRPLNGPKEGPRSQQEPAPERAQDVEIEPLQKVIKDSKKSIVQDIKQASPFAWYDPNNNIVTVGEFVNWMNQRELGKSEVEVFYDKTFAKLKKYAKNKNSATGKVASRILRVYGDINLRGLIGEMVGNVGGQTGLDALQAAFRESLDYAMDHAGFGPKLLRSASAWLIAAIIFGFMKQALTDGAEAAINKVISKISDKSGDLHRQSMTADIKDMFDIPDEILDMLDNAPQADKGDSRKLIRTFMSEYSEKLKVKLEMVQQELDKADDEQKHAIWSRKLKIDDEEAEDQFAKQALLLIKKAYKLKKLAVTLDIGDKEKTITVEHKRRIRIKRSKNVKR